MVHPGSAYYVLQDVWPWTYAASTTNEVMTKHFSVDSQRLGMPYDLRAANCREGKPTGVRE